jgi:hypothetical protein
MTRWISGTCLSAALLLVGLAGPALATDESPEAFVERLYQPYLKLADGLPMETDYSSNLESYFTPDLARLIRADERFDRVAGGLGFSALEYDVFVQGHEADLSDLEILWRMEGESAAMVTVTMNNGGRDQTVYLELVDSAAGWRIDELTWDGADPLRDAIFDNAMAVTGPVEVDPGDAALRARCDADFAAGPQPDYPMDITEEAMAAEHVEIARCVVLWSTSPAGPPPPGK